MLHKSALILDEHLQYGDARGHGQYSLAVHLQPNPKGGAPEGAPAELLDIDSLFAEPQAPTMLQLEGEQGP